MAVISNHLILCASSTHLLCTLLIIMSWFGRSDSLTALGRTSTARQVYFYLNQNNQLASYVSTGGIAVVTGGNSGIGAETVKTLAASGMKVVLCARNIDSANSVRDSLPQDQQERVEIQKLDLADLASVREAATAIQSKYGNIDCLVNNAGIMALKERETTANGVEMQFGTNHVGHHYLTRLLLPQMNDSGRIVTVASTAHQMAKTPIDDWESKESYSPWGAYGRSKLSNILFASQLQKNLDKDGGNPKKLSSVSLHPGVIYSPLWKHALPKLMGPLIVRLFTNKNIEQGAATTVYCALVNRVQGGAYYDDCNVGTPNDNACSSKNQEALWEYTEQLLKEKGFAVPAFGAAESVKASKS